MRQRYYSKNYMIFRSTSFYNNSDVMFLVTFPLVSRTILPVPYQNPRINRVTSSPVINFLPSYEFSIHLLPKLNTLIPSQPAT